MTKINVKRNPATRLRHILSLAFNVLDGNARTRESWCQVFEIPNVNSEKALLEVQSRLLSLRKLFEDTESDLRQIPDINEELFIKPLSRLARVIDINGLHQTWAHYRQFLDAHDMLALKYAEDRLTLEAESQENEISSDEIQEILSELTKLYESILASSLPLDLKNALLDLINEMLRGAHEYRVRGAIALKESLTKSIGILATNKQALDENRDSADVLALGRMLIRVDKAYAFAMRIQPLLQGAVNLFPALVAHIK
ncbi:MAG TPA: hypothetical protein VGO56_02025 [Pyrinomonadaceae bacterium]|jgi:hypothetical protein|nr:hypothetical protein [Pyrinomonadaceae bacterium]